MASVKGPCYAMSVDGTAGIDGKADTALASVDCVGVEKPAQSTSGAVSASPCLAMPCSMTDTPQCEASGLSFRMKMAVSC
jgi:hypothetical protein